MEPGNQHQSEWRRLFGIACDLIDQVRDHTSGYPFQWSFGGGTALMIQIGHRESHDVDIFLDDAQILGFLDPAKVDLRHKEMPVSYAGDGARFQKFAFEGIGEIDFIVAGPLTDVPYEMHQVEGRRVNLETIPEIITKKVYHRGNEAKARDVFDIAAAGREHRKSLIGALRQYPEPAARTKKRLETLNPDFVARTIAQLMILPDYLDMAFDSLELSKSILDEVLA